MEPRVSIRQVDTQLRRVLVGLIGDSDAHIGFAEAVAELPSDLRGRRPRGLPYSAWEQLEHLRIAQWDILEFSRNPDHQSPDWPNGYWPNSRKPPDDEAWHTSVESFRRDNQAMQQLVLDPKRDLLQPLPWGDGQTLLREAMLVADHNSYHIGQLIVIRRLLGAWRV